MIPYSRGASSIAILIKADTGSSELLSKLTGDVEHMMKVWKTVSYVQAWSYMEKCAWEAQNLWEVKNPWGRSRRFIPTTNRRLLSGYGRQGSNFPEWLGEVKQGELTKRHLHGNCELSIAGMQ